LDNNRLGVYAIRLKRREQVVDKQSCSRRGFFFAISKIDSTGFIVPGRDKVFREMMFPSPDFVFRDIG
jgi:hypothetical protein